LQSLSGAAERNENILYVCYDNEAYMNTGIQRSSATPKGASTTTTPRQARKEGPKKNMVAILAAHEIPYIATATIAYPEDLERKVRKARKLEGMKFIHVLSPCPPGWAYPPEKTVKLARLAVLSRIFPLLEVENGKAYRLSSMGEKEPVKEYIRLQGRFKAFTEAEMDELQGDVDEAWGALLSLEARKTGSGRC
jgi:pyruvate/2-oxoacid:ferredoxin oxidoreductase beta subunit